MVSLIDGISVPVVNEVKGVAIGIASSGRACPVEWAIAMATQSYPVNTGLAWIHVVGDSIDSARERIVEEALKKDYKYLWFVDDDTVPPIDAARKLMYVLDQQEAKGSPVAVCGGVYCVKQDPPQPLVFMAPNAGPHWKWRVGDVFECWGLGTGCMMIRLDVFQHLARPWFKTTSEVGFAETDDLYFCSKVGAAGFKVMAHGGVLCRHWDLQKNLIYTLPSKSYPMELVTGATGQ
jgi:GT2 family glycosyltransferase